MEIYWLKINNSNSLFLYNYNSLNSGTVLIPDKKAIGYAGIKNSKKDGC